MLNLLRWVSQRLIKETFVTSNSEVVHHRFNHLGLMYLGEFDDEKSAENVVIGDDPRNKEKLILQIVLL